MKLALVSLQEDKDRMPPLGLVYLATYLDKYLNKESDKVQTKIFDINFQKNMLGEIAEFKPDLIGISAMTIEYGDAIKYAKEIKNHLNVPIIIGGVHISSLLDSFNEIFDVGVIGEGEETLKELVELFLKEGKFLIEDLEKINGVVFYNKNKLIRTKERIPIENLDIIPIPNLNYIDKRYFLPREDFSIGKVCVLGRILTSRGCPYRCVFCSTSRFWKTLRFHSAEYVAKSIKYQIENFGVNYVNVLDDLFTVSKSRLKELIRAFENEGILGKVGFSCQARANLIDEEMCELMRKVGIKSVNFGFESGSQRVLNYLKVGTVTTEMNKKAILLCKKFGFSVFGSLIFGSPGEKIEDMKETLDFMDWSKKNNADYIWTFVATPFPNTPWWEEALKRGKVSNNMDWSKLSHHAIEDAMLIDVDKKQFKEIFKLSRIKSRGFKYKLIFNFIRKYPIFSIKVVLGNPIFYMSKVLTKLFRY